MASNAWERAEQAIARAAERDASVITPDTAVSPFDAATTTVIPHAQAARRSTPPDPDVTQRLPHRGNGTGPGSVRNGDSGRHAAPSEPATEPSQEAPTDQLDPRRGARAAHPGTSPFPASDVPERDGTPATGPATDGLRRPWWRRLRGR